MGKTEKYELMYMQYLWIFTLVGVMYKFFYTDLKMIIHGDYSGALYDVLYCAAVSLWMLAKYKLVNNGMLEKYGFYMINRVVGIFIISVSIPYFQMGQWAYITVVFSIMVTSLTKGSKVAIFLAGYSFVIQSLLTIFSLYDDSEGFIGLSGYKVMDLMVVLLIFYMAIIMFSILCGKIYNENSENENKNKSLLAELGEKYDQLAVAQDKIKYHYDKLKDTNNKLEETNKKLTANIAEFYTLQQISQAISSIFDIRELLKYVNDIILGVMGVNNSTIILMDEKRNRLKVERTNIKNQEEFMVLKDNINCEVLLDVLNKGKPTMENFVDPDVYVFTKNRDVNSLICVPLSSKTKKFGLVLVEHKYFNAFEEENARLLDIIGQQVGIAMENAELYQKMQELATIDGLTGVYNRLYFQQRLPKEIENAREGGYDLSLAIFDVDFFKAFNDTYGHLFGDKVIRHIAEVVKASLRSSDVIARYGGEEFVILFPRTELREAYEKIEALREKIASEVVKDSLINASITASFGLSSFPDYALMENELLKSADNALYEAKASGRNCVKIANNDIAIYQG